MFMSKLLRLLRIALVSVAILAVAVSALGQYERYGGFFGCGVDQIATGPDGNIWFVDSYCNAIGVMTPQGQVTKFTLPSPSSRPSDITTGPDGALWFTEQWGGRIGRITLEGLITEFTVPDTLGVPTRVVTGPDGNLWFTAQANAIGRMTPDGSFTAFAIPTPESQPSGIAVGSDGDIWFTEASGGNIGRIAPSGAITEFPLPRANTGAFAIVAGPGGMWFTESGSEWDLWQVGRISPQGTIVEFPTDQIQGVTPGTVIVGAGGNLWFACGDLYRLTPEGEYRATGYFWGTCSSRFTQCASRAVTRGPDGHIWFAECDTGELPEAAWIDRLDLPQEVEPIAAPPPTGVSSR